MGDHTIAMIDSQGKFIVPDCPIGFLSVRVDLPKAELDRLFGLIGKNPLAGPLLARHLPMISGPSTRLRVHTNAEGPHEVRIDLLQRPGVIESSAGPVQ